MLFFLHSSVGGIYTVIRSKAGVSVEELGDQYCLIGPYNEGLVKTEVEVMEPPESFLQNAIQTMKNSGIKVYFILFIYFPPVYYSEKPLLSYPHSSENLVRPISVFSLM